MLRCPQVCRFFGSGSIAWWLGLVVFCLPLASGCGYFSATPTDSTAEETSGQAPEEGSKAKNSETPEGTAAAPPATVNPLTPTSIPTALPPTRGALTSVTTRPLMIGSFNIQRFGKTKSELAHVMNQLMEITYPFDVLAIQEVVSKDEAVVQKFVASLNAKYGAKFNYAVGPFVGRTTYVERAAYIYDTSRVKLVEQPFILADPDDKLHREPFVARFQVREELSNNPFSFVMVNVHLDPKDAAAELDHISDLLNALQSMFQGQEDDFLFVGDFNLSPGKMFKETKFSARPEWKPVLDDRVMTNTRKNQAYDNILYHVDNTSEFLRRQGVIDLEARFNITLDEALQISDHLPIWAAFALDESGPQNVAGAGAGPVR
ncbi:MAG: endonuclease/exonuclease/phosphatase family protein [Pirellulaceae bacterium]|nr:endonuclease/exonuclease/phosphatase family protein [Pirellulaceae bacterium]